MSCAWRDERCRIGLILGTGTNACYLEEIKDIHTIDQVIIINSLQSLPHITTALQSFSIGLKTCFTVYVILYRI